ncbi:MAG: transcription antitermination factor NusB [Alphaproteobacteria bacterium]|nr:transcription antitermination factor NusB [Alphaproteobacteria bacterium]
MTKFISQKIKMKTSARLAAVQANYMIAVGQLPVDEVIDDFVQGKVGRFAIDNRENENEEKLVELGPIDTEYFEKMVRGAQTHKEDLEKSLNKFLRDDWSYDRMDSLMQALLLNAVYELSATMNIDAKILIQEYVDLAYAFFNKNEPRMVNALLDQIAKEIRG